MIRILLFLSILVIAFINTFSQGNRLREDINRIIKDKHATVGVALIVDGKDTLSVNNNFHYPTQSVYKFYLALAVLDYMDKNDLSLDHKLFIKKSDLLPNTHSPLRDDYPQGEVYMSIADILKYTISKSDNNGCDILFRFLGGPSVVDQYIRSMGIADFSIAKTEEEMHTTWDIQYLNWSTPYTAALVLEKFRTGNILSGSFHDFLWNTMVDTTTGLGKIKAGLPKDVCLAHKTGASFRNADGLNAAENDMGIVRLPDGRYYSLVVFVADSMENQKTNTGIIADISKAVYEYLTGKVNQTIK
ncbi:class A beta-lactamase, subclass A2 [Dysgonomonas sp. Marseille-P4677]|uniref:class A beta-lactamase, subclass A2 n=1 Tax=Dysgonomonas sp. Marseille-P4677 TaxID=2364790 RepID=UPI001EFF52FE|nr:class A beta-lactamase, subclass A2 [Dysgonomonas sp. Marseille-P4677]